MHVQAASVYTFFDGTPIFIMINSFWIRAHTHVRIYTRTCTPTYTFFCSLSPLSFSLSNMQTHMHAHTLVGTCILARTYQTRLCARIAIEITTTAAHVYMNVHIYTCIYISMYTHTCIVLHKYTYVHTHTHVYICIFVHMYIYTHVHTYTYIYIYTHIYIYTYIYVYMYIYRISTYTCVYMYIDIYIYLHIRWMRRTGILCMLFTHRIYAR